MSLGLLLVAPSHCLAAEKQFTVPVHTEIPLEFKYPVYGNSIKKGDLVRVAIAENVRIENALVFKKGDLGTLLVEKSKHSKAFGRGGKLQIQTGSVKDVFGVQLTARYKGDSKASGIILPIISILILWPLVFFALRKGKEAVIPAGAIVRGLTSTEAVVPYSNE